MIRIAISPEAFEARARTLPFGSTGYENQINERGERLIWLEPNALNRLKAMRGPGENYSDVILRLADYNALEQARHLGEIADNVVPIKRGAA
jgi:hypothetical protein